MAQQPVPASDRIAKLPGWARDYLASLVSQVRYAEERLDEIEAQLKIAQGDEQGEDTDVRLELNDLKVALPAGATISYHGIITVKPVDGEAIEVVLIPFDKLTVTVTGDDRLLIGRVP
jgi:hypothetical protein